MVETKLKNLFEKFKLEFYEPMKLNMIDLHELKRKFDQEQAKPNDKFVNVDKNETFIDLSAVIKEFKLQNYNKNLKWANLRAETAGGNFLVYWSLVKSMKHAKFLHVCTNAELYQRQKVDLIVRALEPDMDCYVKYICVGQVKGEDSMVAYLQREEYFRYAAVQRQMIPDEKLVEKNLASLTLFSIVYDLFATGHHKDMCMSSVDLERLAEMKLGEQASFVLYNCARLNAILDKFQSRVKQGRVFYRNIRLLIISQYVNELNLRVVR